MIGKRSAQRNMFEAENMYSVKLPADSFEAQLAAVGRRLFKDDEFKAFYSAERGRPSVPPSVLGLLLLLQHQAMVSDDEAIKRSAFDVRWAIVLETELGQQVCAKSTLQLFRSHLVLHPEVAAIFNASIMEAKRTGLLKGQALRIALDTKPINGRGAVQDTYNLLATGIRQLSKALAVEAREKVDAYLQRIGLDRYTQSSVKATTDIDWGDEQAKYTFLTQIVCDAKKLLTLAASGGEKVRASAKLLEELLLQDVETKTTANGSEQSVLIEGATRGRKPSATDPDVRHGRKSSSKRFNGHKADIAVDEESQLIVGFNVIAGGAGDASGALALVSQVESNTGLEVAETTADCAYGGGPTRKEFADANRTLLAKVPREASPKGLYTKGDFKIDLENGSVTCPAGQTTTKHKTDRDGARYFQFGNACTACPLRKLCTGAKDGRKVRVHPQEEMLQSARAYQKTPEGLGKLRKRVVVEHRLARLGQLGTGQARYKGHPKTRFQLMMAATIANLRLVWNREAADSAQTQDCEPKIYASDLLNALLSHLIQYYAEFWQLSAMMLGFQGMTHSRSRNAA